MTQGEKPGPWSGFSVFSLTPPSIPRGKTHMAHSTPLRRFGTLAFLASIHLAAVTPAGAAVIPQTAPPSVLAPASAPSPDAASRSDPQASEADLAANIRLIQTLSRGQWRAACDQATAIMARQRPDLDALGVFALCAALRNDLETTRSARDALNQREAAPNYYATLVQGILHLKDKAPRSAEAAFAAIREQRTADPLVLYFIGEARHAQGKDAEAIAAFKSSLESWPEHAPALAAIARLSAQDSASPELLSAAISMTEQAAQIEPDNLGYWKQLAELCEQAGDTGRASAIRLQWLTPRMPLLPAGKP